MIQFNAASAFLSVSRAVQIERHLRALVHFNAFQRRQSQTNKQQLNGTKAKQSKAMKPNNNQTRNAFCQNNKLGFEPREQQQQQPNQLDYD